MTVCSIDLRFALDQGLLERLGQLEGMAPCGMRGIADDFGDPLCQDNALAKGLEHAVDGVNDDNAIAHGSRRELQPPRKGTLVPRDARLGYWDE